MFSKDLALKCLDLSMVTGLTLPNIKEMCKKYYDGHYDRLMSEYSGLVGKNLTLHKEPSTDTDWLFYEENDTLYIAFRGSESDMDWHMDFLIDKLVVPFDRDPQIKRDKLHQGFLTCYMSVRDRILDKVNSSGKKNVVVTGHSLGAAQASICSLDVQYNFRDINVVQYSFGTPNVGNAEYCKGHRKYVKEAYLIRNGFDLVSFVPPGVFGYSSIYDHIQVGSKKLFPSLTDHTPLFYYQNITKSL